MANSKGKATQALDLLGDILEDTEEQARIEEARLEAERQKKEQEAKAREEAERKRRQEEADRRIAAEEARRREAAERRSMAEEAMKEVEAPKETVVKTVVQTTQQPEEKSSALPILIAALVLGALAAGGFFGYKELTREYVDADSAYATIEPSVITLNADEAQHRVAILLKPEEQAKEDAIEAKKPKKKSSSKANEPKKPAGLTLGGGISGRK